jgi:hypothetical protein
VILNSLVLTGLRGTGKTVLLDTFKPIAISSKWVWVGADLSESTSISEERIVKRLLADLAIVTASIQISEHQRKQIGFGAGTTTVPICLDYSALDAVYKATPGLPADKLKAVLQLAWSALKPLGHRGIVFAYDEAQNLSDHAAKEEFPLSLLLDVFQSLQKHQLPFLLTLVGLPTLFPKLVEARTFAERMFRVVFLDRLGRQDCRDAILKPVQDAQCPIQLDDPSAEHIIDISGCYPYFIQFICREVYDAFLQGQTRVPVDEITRKLDSDFFAGRWSRVTDRQRELLKVVASLESSDGEFMVQEIAEKSKELTKPFSPSHINQMLVTLANNGMINKNRHGKYSFAVPLLGRFILRQATADREEDPGGQQLLF